MKLPKTIGLAVAVPLVASTVAAPASISGAAAAGPTANAVDADVSLVKPLPCTEQLEARSRCSTPAFGNYSWPLVLG
jgi:hypothetical protein